MALSALTQLITILGDRDDNYDRIDYIHADQLAAMRENWQAGASDEELKSRIIHLRLIYDWPALKSLLVICPGSSTGKFELNDLFNLLDLHIPLGFGVRAPVLRDDGRSKSNNEQFFDARRLIGAKNALKLILLASLYIDYQECIRSKRRILEQYRDFALVFGRRVQRHGIRAADTGGCRTGVLPGRHRIREPQLRSDRTVGAVHREPSVEQAAERPAHRLAGRAAASFQRFWLHDSVAADRTQGG